MLSSSFTGGRLSAAARDARGFTLIETLVAMVTGIVVTGALFAILEVSLHQTARAGDVVQASQLGRTAMSRIANELRSSCMASEFTPVQAKSTTTTLYFRNTYSEKAVPTSATEHKIEWSSEKLTDYSYPSNGGSWPNFTYSSTPSPASGVLVATNVTEGAKPIFQYYKYAKEAGVAETGVPVGTLTLIKLEPKEELGSTRAAEVASVLVTFRAGSTDGLYKTRGGVAEFSNQVTLAFSAPNPEATIVDAPCE